MDSRILLMSGMMIIFHPIFGFHIDHRGSVLAAVLRTADFRHTAGLHRIADFPHTDCFPVHTAGEVLPAVLVRNTLEYWPG